MGNVLGEQIDEVWEPGNMQKVHSEGYNIKIRGSDLQTLRGLEWLNDEVSRKYVLMIRETVFFFFLDNKLLSQHDNRNCQQ